MEEPCFPVGVCRFFVLLSVEGQLTTLKVGDPFLSRAAYSLWESADLLLELSGAQLAKIAGIQSAQERVGVLLWGLWVEALCDFGVLGFSKFELFSDSGFKRRCHFQSFDQIPNSLFALRLRLTFFFGCLLLADSLRHRTQCYFCPDTQCFLLPEGSL